jgi:hypothetical protein
MGTSITKELAALIFRATFVFVYQSARRYIPEERDIYMHHREVLLSHNCVVEFAFAPNCGFH